MQVTACLHSGINLTLVYGDVAITIYMFCWGIKFNSGIKKGKKTCRKFIPGKNCTMSIFLNFLTHAPIIISNFNTFEHKESHKKDFIVHFHEKLNTKR